MKHVYLLASLVLFASEIPCVGQSSQSPIEYIGQPVRGIPASLAVKAGHVLYVSGTPAFDKDGKLAVGDFSAQSKQVMENISKVLERSGSSMDRVVKTTVYLTRAQDFGEMNRVYGSYFKDGKYPARTTIFVTGLPHPDFLLEIECEAVTE